MSKLTLPLKSRFSLYDHQREAIAFMTQIEETCPHANHMKGGLLYMNMGLGKSLISVAHSWQDKQKHHRVYPTLILTSKLLMNEWKTECFEAMFGSAIRVLYFHSDYTSMSELNVMTCDDIITYDFVVTTYDVLASAYKQTSVSSDIRVLKNRRLDYLVNRTRDQCDDESRTGLAILYYTPWTRIIADESQIFANPKTGLFEHVLGLYGDFCWGLTGTPIRNNAVDLWSQLRFCGYDRVLYSTKWLSLCQQFMTVSRLHDYIHEVKYQDTSIQLPPLHEDYISITMSGNQAQCYRQIRQAWKELELTDHAQDEVHATNTKMYAVALFSKLRQCAIAPCLLLTPKEKWTMTDHHLAPLLRPFMAWLHNKQGTAGFQSPKLKQVARLIERLSGDKMLIFSIFTKALQLVKEMIHALFPHKRVAFIHGGVPMETRKAHIDAMKKGQLDILLMTYKVGGKGVNLTQASHVICLEEWWTPDIHAQAIARCHRNGQTKSVTAYHLVMKDTIEERAVELCRKKQGLQKMVSEEVPFKINAKMMQAILA